MPQKQEEVQFKARPWSIAAQFRRDERNWYKENELRRRLGYAWFESEVVKAGEHPIRYALALTSLLVLLIVFGKLVPEHWFIGYWSSWETAEQLNYFTSLWAIQATIVALVYPFAISFVTLLLQRSPSSKAFLHVYLVDSGGLVSGMSSVFLVLAMAVQYMMLATYSIETAVGWVAVDSVWLIYNLILTARFLFRTVEFLRTDSQIEVVKRYAVNVALPRKVANLVGFQYFVGVKKNGWIPGPDDSDEHAQDQPRVAMPDYGLRKGEPMVERLLAERARLANVLFVPLRYAVRSWLKRAAKYRLPETTALEPRPDGPLFGISVTPGRIYEGRTVLCRVAAGPALSYIERNLVAASFWFRAIRLERHWIDAEEILAELESGARFAAAAGDVPAFEQYYSSIIDMHQTLLGASLDLDDDGKQGSWALLPDIFQFAEQGLHVYWGNTYRSLFEAAVTILPRETRPLRRLCYVVQHLDCPEVQKSPPEIRDRILILPTQLMYALANWWSQRIEEQGIIEHGPNRGVLSRPPIQGCYEVVLGDFIGGWETARQAFASLPDRSDNFNWEDAGGALKLSMRHVNETCLMLLRAVSQGDQAASEWMADSLSKWWASAMGYEHEPHLLFEKTSFLTTGLADQTWDVVERALYIREEEWQFSRVESPVLQRAVLAALVRNYWRDIRLLTIEILLSWSTREEERLSQDSLAMYIVTGLLAGRAWRGGGRVEEQLTELTAPRLLTTLARQYAADGGYRSGYRARLDSFVESAKDIVRPSMVSGRVYSYSGADDVASLQDPQLILLAVLSAQEWMPGESLRRQLALWTESDFERTQALRHQVETMKRRLEEVSAEALSPVLPELLRRTGRAHSAEQGLARTRAALTNLLASIEGLQSEAIANAEVSAQRLWQIEIAASEGGFSGGTGEFPLQLFRDISDSNGPNEPFTLTFSKYRKGELTEIEMVQRASNEDDYFKKTIAGHVGALVMSDVIRKCTSRRVLAPNAAAYWALLKEEAQRLQDENLTPLLILDNATRPEWIWEWEHPMPDTNYPRPTDLVFRRERPGRGNGYIADINGIQVFSGPIAFGESILLAKETFARVTFTQFREGVYVKASTQELKESQSLVDLKLTYERNVQVVHPNIVIIQYHTDDATKASETT